MRIDHPEYLWLLVLSVPIILILARNFTSGKTALQRLSGRDAGDSLLIVYTVKSFFSGVSLVLFFVFVVVALAGPAWGRRPVHDARSGLDVVFAVDISRSMLAKDVSPSRLARAIELLQNLVQALPQARYGIVAFKGATVRLVPLTEDRTLLNDLSSVLTPSILSTPGSNVEAAITESLSAFPGGSERSKAVVLITDGEYLGGNPLRAAYRGSDLGIPVFTVGMGTREGSVIRLADGTTLLHDNQRPVISRLNEGGLRAISEITGGKYFSGSDPMTLSALRDELELLQAAKGRDLMTLITVRRYRVFLTAALACLALALSIWMVRWRNIL